MEKGDRGSAPRLPDRMMLRRALFLLSVCGIVAFLIIALRLFRLQVREHESYESAALEQQMRTTTLNADRGTITDRNGKVLALSTSAWSIYLCPAELKRYGEDKELIAAGLSEILNVDAEKLRKLCEDQSSWYKTVLRRADYETTEKVRAFKNEHSLRSVKIESDNKRIYPYSSLASHVIGFVGADNTGLSGVEYSYNSLLTGTNGSVSRLKNSAGSDMLFTSWEKRSEPRDGAELQLSLDVTLQYYLEKQLKQAVEDYAIQNGAAAIAVDPQTGGILAMASLGNFDLNNYASVPDEITELAAGQENADALLNEARQRQWRNKAVSDTYEPGSTFKILTLAMALEEGIVSENSSFYCGGSMNVLGRGKPLKCWKTAGHGSQTLTQAAQHSCNVAFATIGLRLGEETFYRYCEAFGFFKGSEDENARLSGKTGIALPGESGSIWWSRRVFCNSENLSQLAAASFGQTFNITPIQLCMAVSACCNGGYLMEPRLVESITYADGTVETVEPKVLRQVISESTSKKLNAILEQVVSDKKEGTGKNASVAGYRICGKTGTSEKVAQNVVTGEKEYIVSFIGYAPADDPQILVLVLLDAPSPDSGIYISGGQMAAPVVGAFLSEALPYMGIVPSYSAEEQAGLDREVPDLKGLDVAAAAKVLQEAGLGYKASGEGGIITAQLPAAGTTIAKGSSVLLYLDTSPDERTARVPELSGLSYREARETLAAQGLFVSSENTSLAQEDSVTVRSQSLRSGSPLPWGGVVRVTLADEDEGSLGKY